LSGCIVLEVYVESASLTTGGLFVVLVIEGGEEVCRFGSVESLLPNLPMLGGHADPSGGVGCSVDLQEGLDRDVRVDGRRVELRVSSRSSMPRARPMTEWT
jgi:hypothetical protein